MISLIVTFLLFAPPTLHSIPESVQPYIKHIRNEPVFAFWLLNHQNTMKPLTDFIADGNEPTNTRQKAWQMNKKLNNRF